MQQQPACVAYASNQLHESLTASKPKAPATAAFVSACLPDIKLEVASDEQQQEVTYDEASKTVRIPLKATDGGRRTKLVMFTCNQCGKFSPRHLR